MPGPIVPDSPSAAPNDATGPAAAPRSWIAKLAAIAVAAAATPVMVFAWSMLDGNAAWVPGYAALLVVYAVGAVALWSARPWASPMVAGAALFGLGFWVESWCVLGTSPLAVTGAATHGAALVGAAMVPGGLRIDRYRLALGFSGGSLPATVLYAFVPAQSNTTALLAIGGALIAVIGTLGLARGRTWGLLLALIGAPMVAAAVASAPPLVALAAPNAALPQLGSFFVGILGALAAGCSLAAVTPFLVPMVRFVARGDRDR